MAEITIRAIDHVQLAMPRGEEGRARVFYAGVLGLREVPKPPELAKRGGAWFEQGSVKIHLGVEDEFRPAKRAHPALVVDGLAEIVARCERGGYRVTPDVPFAGFRRVHVEDPFGNRLELMEQE
ncbi:MAG TPA: VOC family protein [Candidatus Acidoferrales bacterium]|jgi:catechol 2,3-dioxygenase-like lactoylglutathione lyase family enzyme|nr:VOC family protein [Candidatus Acidoferrales bacterium]